jgi:hypothetical protein
MASKNSNVRKLKTQPKPVLNSDELQRIAEKLAVALEHNTEEISLMTLLFDHLQTIPANLLWGEIYTIKKYLFVGTSEMDEAQERFQANAYANRGKLLMWPYERGTSK